ncbi:MAG: DUF1508 domain-containing protein [Clostridia bacterium]|nr:DUF1508 domain-containing protein [Clostridia bacterium]
MAVGRYEIKKNEAGEYSFRLLTVGGIALAHSGSYKSLPVCKKGIASLRVNADAPLDDTTEADLGVTPGNTPMKCPKIELKNDGEHGGYNFYVRAKNGNVIASGEGYGTKKRCLEAISNLKYIAFSSVTSEIF